MQLESVFQNFGLAALFVLLLAVAALGAYKMIREWFPW